jgi:hypothetical protein
MLPLSAIPCELSGGHLFEGEALALMMLRAQEFQCLLREIRSATAFLQMHADVRTHV